MTSVGEPMTSVGIAQAATHLGLSQDVIRRRLRSGALEGHKEPCGGGFKWLVEVDGVAPRGATLDKTEPPTKGTANTADLVPALVEVLEKVTVALRRQYGLADSTGDPEDHPIRGGGSAPIGSPVSV